MASTSSSKHEFIGMTAGGSIVCLSVPETIGQISNSRDSCNNNNTINRYNNDNGNNYYKNDVARK